MAATLARRQRLAMLRRAAGRRAAALIASGVSPSAGHGAGASGLADRQLAQLRTLAAVTAGAKPGCGTAAVMLLQRRVDYDPIFETTVPLACRLAAWVLEGKGSLAQLQAAWKQLEVVVAQGDLTWATARGPLGATWLSLERVG